MHLPCFEVSRPRVGSIYIVERGMRKEVESLIAMSDFVGGVRSTYWKVYDVRMRTGNVHMYIIALLLCIHSLIYTPLNH